MSDMALCIPLLSGRTGLEFFGARWVGCLCSSRVARLGLKLLDAIDIRPTAVALHSWPCHAIRTIRGDLVGPWRISEAVSYNIPEFASAQLKRHSRLLSSGVSVSVVKCRA